MSCSINKAFFQTKAWQVGTPQRELSLPTSHFSTDVTSRVEDHKLPALLSLACYCAVRCDLWLE